MLQRSFTALLVALLVTIPAFAQDQRGSIEGSVRDTSGAVLPGATVEASSNTGSVASTITDAQGVYRFPSIASRLSLPVSRSGELQGHGDPPGLRCP